MNATENASPNRRQKRTILDGVDIIKLKVWLRAINGHEIMAPQFFTNMGFAPAVVRKCNKQHTSGDTVKETIFGRKGVLPKLRGVWQLDFVEFLADALRVEAAMFYHGRGSMAKEYAKVILRYLEQDPGCWSAGA